MLISSNLRRLARTLQHTRLITVPNRQTPTPQQNNQKNDDGLGPTHIPPKSKYRIPNSSRTPHPKSKTLSPPNQPRLSTDYTDSKKAICVICGYAINDPCSIAP